MKVPSKDYYLVGLQFFLFFLLVFNGLLGYFKLPVLISYLAWLVAIFGLAMVVLAILQLKNALTAFPTPKAEGELIQSGLFTYVRHPIYTGIILFTYAVGVAMGSWWQVLISTLLLLLFYIKSSYEEGLLQKKYPDYARFKASRGRFFPKVFR